MTACCVSSLALAQLSTTPETVESKISLSELDSKQVDVGKLSPDENIRRQIDNLIAMLSSASFGDRQRAVEGLWQLGPEISDQLKNVLNHPDPEVVKRVKTILDAFELGLDSSTPRSTALTILYFETGTANVREQIIRNLESQYEYGMIFELLSRIKDPTARKELYFEEIALDTTIYRLAKLEKWDVIDEILTHDIPWQFDFRLCIYYAQLNETLDDKISQLKQVIARDAERFSQKPNLGPPVADANNNAVPHQSKPKPSDEELARLEYQTDLQLLVRLLRVQGNRKEAIKYAGKIDNEATKYRYVNRLLMEMGDWKAIEDRLTDLDGGQPAKPSQVNSTLAQRALVHYFTGNQETFETVIQRMVEKTKLPQQPKAEQFPKADLMDVLMIVGDWEQAKNYIDKENRLETFQLYSLLQRNEEALESIGLSDDANQRIVWFDRLAKQLNSIFRQYERANTDQSFSRRFNKRVGIANVNENSVQRKADKVFRLGLAAAAQLGSLGFTDEAVLHLRTLADTIEAKDPGSREKKMLILSALVDMKQSDEIWQLIEQRFSENDKKVMMRYLFPHKSSHANYWRNFVSRIYPEHLDQVKAIASILNSPIQIPEVQVDLGEALSLVDALQSSSNRVTRRTTYYEIAMVHFFQGNFQLSRQYMMRAAEERHYAAEIFLANLAFETQDDQQAAEIFDRLWKRTVSSEANAYSASTAAVCFERHGQYEKSRRRQLVAYAAWLDSYRTENIISQFEQHNCEDRLAPMLNISVHASQRSSLTNEYYRYALAKSLIEQEPSESVTNLQIYLFNRLGNSSATGRTFVASMAGQLKRMQALASIKSADLNRAEIFLDNYNRFRPGDPEISERIIPILDRMGESQFADKLFNQLTGFYTATLSRYPDSPLHHNNYAWVCATSHRRLDHAQFHSNLAVQMRPGNSSYLDTQAEILFLLNDKERARELSRACLQIQPMKRHYKTQFLRFGGDLK